MLLFSAFLRDCNILTKNFYSRNNYSSISCVESATHQLRHLHLRANYATGVWDGLWYYMRNLGVEKKFLTYRLLEKIVINLWHNDTIIKIKIILPNIVAAILSRSPIFHRRLEVFLTTSDENVSSFDGISVFSSEFLPPPIFREYL